MIYGIVGSGIAAIVESYEVALQMKDKTTYGIIGGFRTKKEAEQFLFDHRRNEFIQSLKSDIYGDREKDSLLIDYKEKYEKIIYSVDATKKKDFKSGNLTKVGDYKYKGIVENLQGTSLKQEINRISRIINQFDENYNLEICAHNISIPIAIYQYGNLFPSITSAIKNRPGKIAFKYDKRFEEDGCRQE